MAALQWLHVVARVLTGVEPDAAARDRLYDRIHGLTAYRQTREFLLRGGSEQAAEQALRELLDRLGIGPAARH